MYGSVRGSVRQYVAVRTVMCEHHCVHCAQQCAAVRLVVCGSEAVRVWLCGSAAIMCGSVRQCERQCAVVRTVVRTARSARGRVR
jgi:hypothetical protein